MLQFLQIFDQSPQSQDGSPIGHSRKKSGKSSTKGLSPATAATNDPGTVFSHGGNGGAGGAGGDGGAGTPPGSPGDDGTPGTDGSPGQTVPATP